MLRRLIVPSQSKGNAAGLFAHAQRKFSDVSPLRAAYSGLVKSSKIEHDEVQSKVIDRLDILCRSLSPSSKVSYAGPSNAPMGVYMYGGVGSGKTFMMDLFYDSAPVDAKRKRRMHFSEFMHHVHAQMLVKQKEREEAINSGFLKRYLPKIHDDIGGTADSSDVTSFNFFGARIVLNSGSGSYNSFDKSHNDPLPLIASEFVAASPLLCLDEFEVIDVADAFILARLFDALFKAGLILVTTSNRPPADLYQDGLNREVFLPTISKIESHCDVVSLTDSSTDYRSKKSRLLGATRYVVAKSGASSALDSHWCRLVGDPAAMRLREKPRTVAKSGRKITVPHASGRRCCSFTFREMMQGSQALGAVEYRLLTEEFDTIFIEDVPNFNEGGCSVDALRRFVTFIDVCYDARVEMFFSSEHKIKDLWDSKKEIRFGTGDEKRGDLLGTALYVSADTFTRFSLDRAISRLLAMESDEYIEESAKRKKQA